MNGRITRETLPNVNVLTPLVRAERRQTLESVKLILAGVGSIAQHTLNERKIAGFLGTLRELEMSHVKVTPFESGIPEPVGTPSEIAFFKAICAYLATKQVSVGQDIGHYTEMEDGSYAQQHKMSRITTAITHQQFDRLEKSYLQKYSYTNGPINPRWKVATDIKNGHHASLSGEIQVTSKPIDPDLLRTRLRGALDNGALYNSNSGFELWETLNENNGLIAVSLLPQEVARHGVKHEQMKQRPSEWNLGILSQAIIHNQPFFAV